MGINNVTNDETAGNAMIFDSREIKEQLFIRCLSISMTRIGN